MEWKDVNVKQSHALHHYKYYLIQYFQYITCWRHDMKREFLLLALTDTNQTSRHLTDGRFRCIVVYESCCTLIRFRWDMFRIFQLIKGQKLITSDIDSLICCHMRRWDQFALYNACIFFHFAPAKLYSENWSEPIKEGFCHVQMSTLKTLII